jgi:GNAT superfamily N-acetyltransferase
MTTRPTVEVESSANAELRSRVQALLRDYNTGFAVAGPHAHPITARAVDQAGEFLGGCVAETYWGWLVIDVLAVEEPTRGHGVGTALVDAVEMEARSRGCTKAHTTAWQFQGLGFWTHRGYRVVGELADYPDGHTFSWLRKEL